MTPEYRPLVMRANRLLGAALVEANLVKIEDLEQANERLLSLIPSAQSRNITLLGILAYELRVLKEEQVLEHLVDSAGLGLIDLSVYDINEELRKSVDIEACWATWSLPFDREDGLVSIASAYTLSPAVLKHWEKEFGKGIIWFGTALEPLADLLEKIGAERGHSAG